MRWLTDPLAYAFFGRALVAGVLIGAMCGALSAFVVLRRMSYIGHGLAHSVLGGAVVGAALGYNLYVGMIGATVLSALLIDRVSRRRGLHADAAIGIVTTAMFALGIVAVSAFPVRLNLEALLFGNILGVTRTDLVLAAAAAAAFAVLLGGWYKRLVFCTFDPEVAAVHGIRVDRMEAMFNLLTAAVVIVSVRVLGVLLIAAAVVIPGAMARLLTTSLGRMLGVATMVGLTGSIAGLYASYHLDVPSGPAIVLTEAVLFGAAFAATAAATAWKLGRARRAVAGSGGAL